MIGFSRFFMRFRYPVTLPEDVGDDLGIQLSNYLTFEELMSQLLCPDCNPQRLSRYMSREQAEAVFQTAQRKERFSQKTLCSYYFNEGWVEFILNFDDKERLRRLYLIHKKIKQDSGIEIPLQQIA